MKYANFVWNVEFGKWNELSKKQPHNLEEEIKNTVWLFIYVYIFCIITGE